MMQRILIQVTAYLLFFVVIYYFSTAPAYHYLKPGQGEIKLAFKHTSQRQAACHKRTHEELMRLPPNMRRVEDCPRQRSVIYLELLLDDQVLANKTFIPPGLSRDMATFVYAKFALPAGRHRLTVRMRDSTRMEGFDFTGEQTLDWIPGQSVLIGFDAAQGEFQFH